MTIPPPRRRTMRRPSDPAVWGRARRKPAGQILYDVMSDMMFRTSRTTALRSRRCRGADRPRADVEDGDFAPLSYGRLPAVALVLEGA